MGWDYNSHIVCMCIIIRWSRNRSASWAERFWTSSLLCTYKLCDYYTPIPILSPFLFTPSLYVAILNLQNFSFTCYIVHGHNQMVNAIHTYNIHTHHNENSQSYSSRNITALENEEYLQPISSELLDPLRG